MDIHIFTNSYHHLNVKNVGLTYLCTHPMDPVAWEYPTEEPNEANLPRWVQPKQIPDKSNKQNQGFLEGQTLHASHHPRLLHYICTYIIS